MLRKMCVLFLLFIACSKNPTNSSEWKSWKIRSPASQQMDADILNDAIQHAKNLRFLLGLVVTRNGYIVSEYYREYFYSVDSVQSTFSVTKSVVSALIGIAYHEGYIESLNKKIMDYFPEYKNYVIDSRISNVTIRQLLTMKGGFNSDMAYLDYLLGQDDWLLSVLRRCLVYPPGEEFFYSSFGAHLLSGILTKATGRSTSDFAEEVLFGPLSIEKYEWLQEPNGTNMGGYGLSLRTRDMATFGYLYLKKGNLKGKQIIPESWIDASFQYDTSFSESWGDVENLGYGYLWWLGDIGGEPIYMASGRHGQFIFVIPSLDMVIATSALNKDDGTQSEQILNFVTQYILPAVR